MSSKRLVNGELLDHRLADIIEQDAGAIDLGAEYFTFCFKCDDMQECDVLSETSLHYVLECPNGHVFKEEI